MRTIVNYGAWSIPKGEIDPDEDPEQAVRRSSRKSLPSPSIGALQRLARSAAGLAECEAKRDNHRARKPLEILDFTRFFG